MIGFGFAFDSLYHTTAAPSPYIAFRSPLATLLVADIFLYIFLSP
jgi:hypothetical protein